MLDHAETMELLKKSKTGDDKAKETLIVNNIQLVKSIVKRYRYHQVEYEDLMQLGSIGLLKAINNFDLSYNVRFSTYAVPMIAGEIKRFLRDDGIIKVSRAAKVLAAKTQAYINTYTLDNGESPSIESIAKQLCVEPQEIAYALEASKFPVSIYEKIDEDSNQCLLDKIVSDETSEDLINRLTLKDIIKTLPDKEKKVIVLRYYRDKTQSEVATILGVSQVQVSRIENKVLEVLRESFLNN